MGKIKDYELPSAEIAIDATHSFSVSGISFEDITALASKHMPILSLLFAKFEAQKDIELTPESVGALIYTAATEFPEVVAHMIALAAGEPDQVTKIAKMPFTVHVEAIEKIIGLTFTSEAEVKKLVETVTRILEKVNVSMALLNADSGNGNGAFVSK